MSLRCGRELAWTTYTTAARYRKDHVQFSAARLREPIFMIRTLSDNLGTTRFTLSRGNHGQTR